MKDFINNKQSDSNSATDTLTVSGKHPLLLLTFHVARGFWSSNAFFLQPTCLLPPSKHPPVRLGLLSFFSYHEASTRSSCASALPLSTWWFRPLLLAYCGNHLWFRSVEAPNIHRDSSTFFQLSGLSPGQLAIPPYSAPRLTVQVKQETLALQADMAFWACKLFCRPT